MHDAHHFSPHQTLFIFSLGEWLGGGLLSLYRPVQRQVPLYIAPPFLPLPEKKYWRIQAYHQGGSQSCLISRPLISLNQHDDDGLQVLMPEIVVAVDW